MSSKVVRIAVLGAIVAFGCGGAVAADTPVKPPVADVNLKAGPAGAIGMTPITKPKVAKKRSTGTRR